MIQIKQLTFSYSKQKELFHQLDLELETGNIYGLLGRNGAGKTTLLKLITGMLLSNKGTITVDSKNVTKRLPETLEEMYFIPEEFELPFITAWQFMDHYGKFYPKADTNDFKKYLDAFGVEAEIPMGRLSFGQRKQVLISFGLASNTRYLILDEPSNGLDIPSKSILRKLLAAAITDERCFIISTHQVRDLEHMIDPIIILDQGKIIFNQTSEQITQKLAFGHLKALDDSPVIFSEAELGGYAAICKNMSTEPSSLNIEMLFKGVVSQPETFQSLFQPKK